MTSTINDQIQSLRSTIATLEDKKRETRCPGYDFPLRRAREKLEALLQRRE